MFVMTKCVFINHTHWAVFHDLLAMIFLKSSNVLELIEYEPSNPTFMLWIKDAISGIGFAWISVIFLKEVFVKYIVDCQVL